MSEPSSSVPGEIADAEMEQRESQRPEPARVELEVDEQKVEAWDEVKSDYEVEPDGQSVPNSMDLAGFISGNADVVDDTDDDSPAPAND